MKHRVSATPSVQPGYLRSYSSPTIMLGVTVISTPDRVCVPGSLLFVFGDYYNQ